jgi:hypothetical protein
VIIIADLVLAWLILGVSAVGISMVSYFLKNENERATQAKAMTPKMLIVTLILMVCSGPIGLWFIWMITPKKINKM